MSVESAVSGIGSLASAFGGSGGSSGGGTVVGGPSPFAALQAGQIQSQAAQAAADAAKSAVQDAISSINKNYQQARYDVQPYRQEGVQALDQLNQYLGLAAYNPGAAPDAPKFYTAADLSSKIKNSAINTYIQDNVQYTPTSVVTGGKNAGKYPDGSVQVMPTLNIGGTAGPNGNGYLYNPAMAGGFAANPNRGGGGAINGILSAQSLDSDPQAQDWARTQLAQEMADDKNSGYDDAVSAYNRDTAEWQQNLDWYNQYQAEGPKTQQQITDEITAQPGYAAEQQQGVDAISKSAAANGYIGSGRILKELSTFGQNTLSKYYNNTLDRLQQLVGVGANAAGATAAQSAQQGQLVGQAQIGLGDTLANSALAAGNAQAQGILAANQQYKVIGGSSGGK